MARIGVLSFLHYNYYKPTCSPKPLHLIAKRFYYPMFIEEKFFSDYQYITYIWRYKKLQYQLSLQRLYNAQPITITFSCIVMFADEEHKCHVQIGSYNRSKPTEQAKTNMKHVLYKRIVRHYQQVIPFLRELIS